MAFREAISIATIMFTIFAPKSILDVVTVITVNTKRER